MKVERVPRLVYEHDIQITLEEDEVKLLSESLSRAIDFYVFNSPNPYVLLRQPCLSLNAKLLEVTRGFNNPTK